MIVFTQGEYAYNKEITMPEYKIIHGTAKHCQMVLNQWRHDYYIEILSFESVNVGLVTGENVTILLTREEI
jgi:hypothetical protein